MESGSETFIRWGWGSSGAASYNHPDAGPGLMTRHITTVKSPQQKISVYIPPLFKKKRVKSSNYKWLYSLNISYINIITIYSLLCFAVLEAVTLMYSGVHVNLIEQLCILREDSLLLGTSQWIQNLELFILICLSSVSPLSLSSYLSAAITQLSLCWVFL